MLRQKTLDLLKEYSDIMNKAQAKKILRELAKEGSVIISSHCKKQMLKRNVSTDDILHVLMWGKISGLKKDEKYNNWKCKVEGQDFENDKLVVMATVSEKNGTIIITVF